MSQWGRATPTFLRADWLSTLTFAVRRMKPLTLFILRFTFPYSSTFSCLAKFSPDFLAWPELKIKSFRYLVYQLMLASKRPSFLSFFTLLVILESVIWRNNDFKLYLREKNASLERTNAILYYYTFHVIFLFPVIAVAAVAVSLPRVRLEFEHTYINR